MATVKGTPRAVIYCRVSTEQQGEGTSLAGQFAACAKRASDEGAQVVAAFEETKSGALYQSREELQKALALIESGDADTLILAKLDRTGRDVDDLRDVRRRVERAGARMVFADGMTFEKGAVGNLLFTQLGAFAEFERELIKERTVAGIERVARSGKAPSRTVPPYGYIIVTKAHITRREYPHEFEGTYVVNSQESQYVPLIFEMVAAGHSLRQIVIELDKRGIKPRSARSWCINSLITMVRNPIYKGAPVWRKTRRHVNENRAKIGLRISFSSVRPDEEQIPLAPCEELVSPELWQRAGKVLERGRQERSGNQTRRYLLTGFLRCPQCGDRISSRISTHTSTRGRVSNRVVRCVGARRKTCNAPGFTEALVESQVIEAIHWLLSQPSTITEAQTAYLAMQQQKRAKREKTVPVGDLYKQLDKARVRERTLAEALIEARVAGRDGSAFAEMQSEAEADRTRIEKQIKEMESQDVPLDDELPSPLESQSANDFLETIKGNVLPSGEKALMLRQLVSRIYPVPFSDTALSLKKVPKVNLVGAPRNAGGVRLVLHRGAEAGFHAPFYVLSCILKSRTKMPDGEWRLEYEKTLELFESDSFPPLPARCGPSRLDKQNLYELST